MPLYNHYGLWVARWAEIDWCDFQVELLMTFGPKPVPVLIFKAKHPAGLNFAASLDNFFYIKIRIGLYFYNDKSSGEIYFYLSCPPWQKNLKPFF